MELRPGQWDAATAFPTFHGARGNSVIVHKQSQGAVKSQLGWGKHRGSDNSRGERGDGTAGIPIGNGNAGISSPRDAAVGLGLNQLPNPGVPSHFSRGVGPQSLIVQHERDPEFLPWEKLGISLPGGNNIPAGKSPSAWALQHQNSLCFPNSLEISPCPEWAMLSLQLLKIPVLFNSSWREQQRVPEVPPGAAFPGYPHSQGARGGSAFPGHPDRGAGAAPRTRELPLGIFLPRFPLPGGGSCTPSAARTDWIP